MWCSRESFAKKIESAEGDFAPSLLVVLKLNGCAYLIFDSTNYNL